MQLAEGLELLPGADGVLPVRARWVALAGNTAALAVDGDRVYVASGELTAIGLVDGSVALGGRASRGLGAGGQRRCRDRA